MTGEESKNQLLEGLLKDALKHLSETFERALSLEQEIKRLNSLYGDVGDTKRFFEERNIDKQRIFDIERSIESFRGTIEAKKEAESDPNFKERLDSDNLVDECTNNPKLSYEELLSNLLDSIERHLK